MLLEAAFHPWDQIGQQTALVSENINFQSHVSSEEHATEMLKVTEL